MEKIIKVYKKEGETPLERLERLRNEDRRYRDKKLSYAGRLDPMAEGVMLVLVGVEANRQREKYLCLPKSYLFEALFCFVSDTHDILGIVKKRECRSITKKDIGAVLQKFRGKIKQSYPAYSSKTVKGKHLFEWAREGKIETIDIPVQDVEINEFDLTSFRKITASDIRKDILERVMKIRGDFRQDKVLDSWDEALRGTGDRDEFQIAGFRVLVSSGTYVRKLVHDIGNELGTGAIAYRIIREDVLLGDIDN